MDETQYAEFINRLETDGQRQDFEVIIRTAKPEIQLTSSEITDILYAAVNKKADELEGEKPHFDIQVSTYTVNFVPDIKL